MNLGIIRRETQARLCFVSESHGFTSVYLGMEGSATSCDRESRPAQTWDTEVKPGAGGCRQSAGKSLWKNLLHHQDSGTEPHKVLEVLNPTEHRESVHTVESEAQPDAILSGVS